MKKRFYAIDAIRGFALVNMVLFHFLYDVFVVFGKDPFWYLRPNVYLWQQSICWTFILVSGFVWSWGRKNAVKRGLLLNFWGLIVTLVTVVFLPEERIFFGILNFFGCAVLIIALFEKPLSKLSAWIGVPAAFSLFLLTKNISDGVIGVWQVPKILYDIKVLTPFGFPYPGFVSSDYFGIFPWIFLFITGFYLEKLFRKSESLQKYASVSVPVLTKIGKNTIWVYLLHQPICYAICLLIFS